MPGQDKQTAAVVVSPETAGALGIITDDLVRSAGAQAVKLRQLQDALLGAVRPGGITNMQGTPYFEDATIQTWRLLVGIEFPEQRFEREECSDAKGNYVRFICHKTAIWGGRKFVGIGTASTRDPFFAKADGEMRAEEDIDQNNPLKKAETNAEHRLVMKLLGMGAIEWKDLQKFGIQPSGSRGVNFGSTAAAATTGAGRMSPKKIELLGRLQVLCENDMERVSQSIAGMTANRQTGFKGYRMMKAVPDDHLERIEKIIAEEEAKRRKAAEEEPEPDPAAVFGGEREPGEEG